MKKLFFVFSLLSLFALSVPKDANANMEMFPGTYDICGNTCLCWDQEDMDFYTTQYC